VASHSDIEDVNDNQNNSNIRRLSQLSLNKEEESEIKMTDESGGKNEQGALSSEADNDGDSLKSNVDVEHKNDKVTENDVEQSSVQSAKDGHVKSVEEKKNKAFKERDDIQGHKVKVSSRSRSVDEEGSMVFVDYEKISAVRFIERVKGLVPGLISECYSVADVDEMIQQFASKFAERKYTPSLTLVKHVYVH